MTGQLGYLKLLGLGLGKQKIAILVVWFLSLVCIRMLLGFALSNVWMGTLGSVAITFGIFYLALLYTPLRKYRFAVSAMLKEWYSKKYLLYSVAISGSVIVAIIILIEYGYTYHSDEIISIQNVDSILGAQEHADESIKQMTSRGLSLLDASSIIAASVDKSLQGYYLKSASFVFAEHLEVMIFLLLARRSSSLFN